MALQPRVLRLVDYAHPALPELVEDAVVGDRGADHADEGPEKRQRNIRPDATFVNAEAPGRAVYRDTGQPAGSLGVTVRATNAGVGA
jgi:hypothetical protein